MASRSCASCVRTAVSRRCPSSSSPRCSDSRSATTRPSSAQLITSPSPSSSTILSPACARSSHPRQADEGGEAARLGRSRSCRRQLAGAVPAARRRRQDLLTAELAELRRGGPRYEGPRDEEYHERDDDEGDHRVDEHAVVDRRRARILRRLQGRVALAGEVDEQVLEVDSAEKEADRRHEDVLHQRVDDGRQRDTDDERESQGEDVRLQQELLELGHHGWTSTATSRAAQHAECRGYGLAGERYTLDGGRDALVGF